MLYSIEEFVSKSKSSRLLLQSNQNTKIYALPQEDMILKVSKLNLREGALHREASSLSKHIVKYKSSFRRNSKINILMERCEETLLQSIRDRQPNVCFWGTKKLLKSMKDLLSALKRMHSHHIVHRDIKPDNIFASFHGKLKLGDFGSSKKIKNLCFGTTGTPSYQAPELLDKADAGYDYYKCDVWSLGKTFFEMCSLQLSIDLDGLKELEISDLLTRKMKEVNPAIVSVIKDMMKTNPQDRLDSKTAYKRVKSAYKNIKAKSCPSQRTQKNWDPENSFDVELDSFETLPSNFL